VSDDASEFRITSATESHARAAAVLPTLGSEDAAHVLGQVHALEVGRRRASDEGDHRDYLPCEDVDWVLTATFTGTPHLDPHRVRAAFDAAWCAQYGRFTAFGRDAATNRWTFLISADGPSAVTDLKLAWDYCDPLGVDPPATSALFQRRLDATIAVLSSLGQCHLEASKSASEAGRTTTVLNALKRECDRDAAIVLQAPRRRPYDGRRVWDVMLCLGLRWGDMDCFHWANPTTDGPDAYFSVHTTTPPGYFLPEALASGRMQPADLAFTFSIPRSVAPGPVFDCMARAVEYCRTRLGGTTLDDAGQPADLVALREYVVHVDRQMRRAGFVPGSHRSLRLF